MTKFIHFVGIYTCVNVHFSFDCGTFDLCIIRRCFTIKAQTNPERRGSDEEGRSTGGAGHHQQAGISARNEAEWIPVSAHCARHPVFHCLQLCSHVWSGHCFPELLDALWHFRKQLQWPVQLQVPVPDGRYLARNGQHAVSECAVYPLYHFHERVPCAALQRGKESGVQAHHPVAVHPAQLCFLDGHRAVPGCFHRAFHRHVCQDGQSDGVHAGLLLQSRRMACAAGVPARVAGVRLRRNRLHRNHRGHRSSDL